jgi:DNA ligase 1
MLYSLLVDAYEKISRTTKRLEISSLLVGLLKETPSSIIDKVVYLTQGKLYPDYLGIEVGIAEKLAIKCISAVAATAESRVTTEYKAKGDLGTAAEQLLETKTQSALEKDRLTVEDVYSGLDRIARSTGSGSIEAKIRQLTGLLSKASPVEAKYLIRTSMGRLRLGVADMTILDALAQAFAGGKDSRAILEHAYNRSSDLGLLAKTVAVGGIREVKSFKITVGIPIRPMLAERLPDAKAILAKMNGAASAEYKYDGLRIQAHIFPKGIAMFSRRLENITDQFPDVQQLLTKGVGAKEVVLEGETVPIDSSTGDLLPFQLVSQRRGRKYELEKTISEIPVAMFAFDLLYADGVDYTSQPYPNRRAALERIVRSNGRLGLSRKMMVRTPEELDDFMQQAIADGCEGLMIKSIGPDSIYQAGSRGWTWIKYKREYKSEMQDTVDIAVVGAFAGRGRRGGAYGALLLAAYDEKDDTFRTVCKCGSGFTDDDLSKLPGLLDKYRIDHKHPRVDSKIDADSWFVPGLVIEVIGAEITLSPIHTCGMNSVRPGAGLAIRFPRFTGRYRTEKAAEDATTTVEIVEMYNNQLKKIEAKPMEIV